MSNSNGPIVFLHGCHEASYWLRRPAGQEVERAYLTLGREPRDAHLQLPVSVQNSVSSAGSTPFLSEELGGRLLWSMKSCCPAPLYRRVSLNEPPGAGRVAEG